MEKKVWVVLEDENQWLINFLYVVLSCLIGLASTYLFTKNPYTALIGGAAPAVAVYFLVWGRGMFINKAVGIVVVATVIISFIMIVALLWRK
ncbi:MAG: hypothetical protein QXF56_02395 [Candidatus Micrarchaeia archaeon]